MGMIGQLLGVDGAALHTGLKVSLDMPISRAFKGGTGCFVPPKPNSGSHQRHVFAAALYSSVFHFIIERINGAFASLAVWDDFILDDEDVGQPGKSNESPSVDALWDFEDPEPNIQHCVISPPGPRFINEGQQLAISVIDAFTFSTKVTVQTPE